MNGFQCVVADGLFHCSHVRKGALLHYCWVIVLAWRFKRQCNVSMCGRECLSQQLSEY